MKRIFVKDEYLEKWAHNNIDRNGIVIRIDTYYTLKGPVRDWLKERCIGHWEHFGAMKYIVFENDKEALLFKLRWG